MQLRRKPLALGLAAAGAAAAALAFPATAAEPAKGSQWQSVYFPSRDGTSLHGDLMLPENGCPDGGCPVIVSIGPYYGHSTQGSSAPLVPSPTYEGPSDRFYDFINHEFEGKGTIFEQGYAWLQVDSRGYGVSGGCSDYGGPGEQMDVAAAVEWAGTQPWSSGKVGMWGKSYDAWTQVMGLAMNPPHLEAVVIQSPLTQGYGIGYVNGVHHSATWYATTSLYMLYDYTPNALDQTDPQALVNTTTGAATDPCWARQQAVIAAGWDKDLEYWRQRDLQPSAKRNDDVAVLWSHGFNDVNTKPDQIFGVYEGLNQVNGDKTRAWFGQWAHDRGNESQKVGRTGFLEEALDWFDYYLKGEPFEYSVNEKNVVEVQDNEGGWRTEATYPPSDAKAFTLPIRDGSYVDDGLRTAGPGYWTVTPELEYTQRISGEPVVNVTADIQGPFANLVGVLYDIDPAGTATEIARSAYRLEGDGPVSFRMFPADYVVPAGHRLAFHVTDAHPQFLPQSTNTTVAITEGSVQVPFLTYERQLNLEGQEATARPYVVSPNAADLQAGVVDTPMPPEPLVPDAATAEALQPTVTAPGGLPE